MSDHSFKTPYVSIDQAVQILSSGGLVALPTETVYGLAAIANSPNAVRKIFEAKGRPADHPLIVHVSSFDEVQNWVAEIPKKAKILANHFWPGPLTMVFKKASNVDSVVTGGQDTIALRIPNQSVTLQVLQKLGSGVAAPSANRFGRVSPTLPTHVLEELDGLIDGVVEGGQCDVGIESTIVDLSSDVIRLLRPGHISLLDLETCLGEKISVKTEEAPRVPGLLKSHYAPNTPLKLVESKYLEFEIASNIDKNQTFNLWSFEIPKQGLGLINWVQAPNDPQKYAHELYDQLRRFDVYNSTKTLIEMPPANHESWRGVLDRLLRAQAHFE